MTRPPLAPVQHLVDEAGDDVAVFNVEVVVRAVDVRGDHAGELGTELLAGTVSGKCESVQSGHFHYYTNP